MLFHSGIRETVGQGGRFWGLLVTGAKNVGVTKFSSYREMGTMDIQWWVVYLRISRTLICKFSVFSWGSGDAETSTFEEFQFYPVLGRGPCFLLRGNSGVWENFELW